MTALAIDVLNIVFERQTIKFDCVLIPAFIKGMASTTNILVRFFVPVMAFTDMGRPVVVQRYICWMHTTPSILMLLKMISSTITPKEALTAIMFDEIMVITGVLGLITTGWQRVLWAIVTHVAMVPVLPYMHKAFTEAMEQVRTRPLQLTMLVTYVLNLILWCVFAITWDLALLDWISVQTEEILYVGCDFSAKVIFSSTLMLSSFKEIEARRENAMRVIEGTSKAKLIAELQALLEQKERFMSSVSHELRTPLNGIIGISEGMLSGCCGVLPEGVRRQIYIIRTSGARLLALINDVMDAAALRQNKLVLKQEQVILRHVVDDVLDLTRSLVDAEVSLVNLVPPRMVVVGDTGRIVQILNNLLGNAAKFTRRGQIRVSARQVESGRKVAVTVSDTGIGIPRNKLATIFLPFEQVDMSISRKYGGFGLGLNIVQELVKAHGGTINVSSIEGKGSAFTFTLPLLRALGRESLEEGKAAAARSAGFAAASSMGGASQTTGTGTGNGTGTGTGNSGEQRTGTGRDSERNGNGGAGQAVSRSGGGGGGEDNSSTVLSSSDAGSRHRAGVQGGGSSKGLGAGGSMADQELEKYGELQYNAAELSALASSKPYAQSARDSATVSSMDAIEPLRSPTAAAAQTKLRRRPKAPAAAAAAGGGPDAAAAAMAAAAAAALASTGGADPAAVAALPGGDAKIVHGPRPFHYTMYRRFLLLSVDDDLVNQSVVKSLLGSTGYEVVAVPSGPEALKYVASAPALPDLVLLDCMMPEMDGYEVLQRLRAMTPNVHLPIIMVSAQTEEDHVVCGLDLGADDYVTKPFKRNELLARIRAQLAYGDWEQDEAGFENLPTVDFNALGGGTPGGGSSAHHAAAAGAVLGILDSGAALDLAAGVGGGLPALAGPSPHLDGVGGLERSSSPGASGGDMRLILCIDDDDVNQVVLQGMLTSQHYRYVRASTGAQGLAYVCGPQNGGIPPDLVLLDCSLPDMTGFDVCRCIRQMYNKQQVPIIMLSARHNESAVVEGLKCGANTYVTKPFRRNELLARIRLHLRSREQTPGRNNNDSSSVEDAAAAALAALHDGPGPGHHGHTTTSTSGALPAATGGGGGGGGGGSVAAIITADARAAAALAPPAAAAAAAAAAYAQAAAGVAAAGGVRLWAESAVLVVAVADYAGLCRMLLPTEMAELSGRMLSAFERTVAAHGAVVVEAGSGVMSAAVLPAAPPQPGPAPDAAAMAAAAGLRLAALHRVGRALLEAAATIAVPGTTTCLQLQIALALGTIMGSGSGSESAVQYFGPVLAELLDLARRAPPMTIVTADAEAQALKASGATADIRGPLFLEADDGGAAGAAAARRLWLVESHPLAHQYLPPQLLYMGSTGRSTFMHSGVEEFDGSLKASTSGMALAPPPAGGAAGLSRQPSPATAGVAAAAQRLVAPANGGGGGAAATLASPIHLGGGAAPPGAVPMAVDFGRASASTSIFNTNLGLYGPGAAATGLSRNVSRTMSHTFAMDGEAAPGTHARASGVGGVAIGVGAAVAPSANGMSHTSGTTGTTVRGAGTNTGSNGSIPMGLDPISPAMAPLASSSGAGITFSLQAAAAAVAAATAAGGGPGGANSGPHEPAAFHMASGSTLTGGMASQGPSLLYGTASSALLRAAAPHPAGSIAVHSDAADNEAAAAEPQIRALRSEIAAMRQAIQALTSAGGSVGPVSPFSAAAAAGGGGALPSQGPPPLPTYGQLDLPDGVTAPPAPPAPAAAAAPLPPGVAAGGGSARQSGDTAGGNSAAGLQAAGSTASASGAGGESLGDGWAPGADKSGSKKGSKLTRLFKRSSKSGGTK
ncbi:hypothetical protein HYH03_013724 [Edaphochlamys debaryana]|uniref:histidine kinase n=1 Tax=Edaphochlamys debaryana TaxID=47281 RepID=A0A835XQF1_9CHLO|nr:hypothetical protein HYH03_013724 [Edaphochlamys debaryana]|eukprot:KAG2487725.1 hypothetical protein HYH03_013724 [Edaphochlamys debaryana]